MLVVWSLGGTTLERAYMQMGSSLSLNLKAVTIHSRNYTMFQGVTEPVRN